jgi:hypothetical protein
MQLNDLRQQRNKLVADAQAIVNRADGEKRSATAEEREQIDRLMNESDVLAADIRRLERVDDAERDLRKSSGRIAGANTVEKRDVEALRSSPGVPLGL